MDAAIFIVGFAIADIIFPIVAAVIAFKRGRTGWGIATLVSIFLLIGWLVGIFALIQKPKSRTPFAIYMQDGVASSPGSSPTDGIGTRCENCGARTSLGVNYNFIQAYKAKAPSGTGHGVVHVSRTVSQTRYILVESAPVFLCNKCVTLHPRRKASLGFRNALFIILAVLVISIPVSLFMKNLFFLTPTMVLIFAGPLVLYQRQALKFKESAPLRAYRDLHNNPEYPNPRGRSDPLLQQVLTNAGESLAIHIKAPSLAKTGVDALFIHETANKKLKLILPGKINLDMQKQEGLRHILIGSGLGIAILILILILPWEGADFIIGYLGGLFCLSYLSWGFGILESGNPGGTLTSTFHWYCPYCNQELTDDDLPTPGYHAACPKCGRIFGRKGWDR